MSSLFDNKEVAYVLLDHGADPKAANKAGERPIDTAPAHCFVKVVYMLLKHGATGRVANEAWERVL